MKAKLWTLASILALAGACNQSGSNGSDESEEANTKEQFDYKTYAENVAQVAQQQLFKKLSGAIARGGPAHAVEFCNHEALPLTDSISLVMNAKVGRISTANRNPGNAPSTKLDRKQLQEFAQAVERGSAPIAKTHDQKDRIVYYKPIMLQMETCLKCHGKPGKDINEETMARLQELYPEDKATGFEIGQLRGAWRIELEKS